MFDIACIVHALWLCDSRLLWSFSLCSRLAALVGLPRPAALPSACVSRVSCRARLLCSLLIATLLNLCRDMSVLCPPHGLPLPVSHLLNLDYHLTPRRFALLLSCSRFRARRSTHVPVCSQTRLRDPRRAWAIVWPPDCAWLSVEQVRPCQPVGNHLKIRRTDNMTLDTSKSQRAQPVIL